MPRISYEQHLAEKAASRENRRRRGSIVESETDAESLFSSTTYQSQSSSSPYIPSRAPLAWSTSHTGNHHLYGYTPVQRTISSASYEFAPPSSSPDVGLRRERSVSPIGLRNDTALTTSTGNNDQNTSFPFAFPPTHTLTTLPLKPQSDNEDERSFTKLSSSSNTESLAFASASGVKGKKQSQSTHLAVPSHQKEISRAKREKRRKDKLERSTLQGQKFDSPLRSWIRWMNNNGLYDYTVTSALIFALAIKFTLLSIFEREYELQITWSWGMVSDLMLYGPMKQRIMDEIMWSAVVYSWAEGETKRGGRSKRSHIIAMTTVLLSPMSLSSGRTSLPMSMILHPISTFTDSPFRDPLSLSMIALSLTVVQFHWLWAVGAYIYIIGKSVWIGGLQGVKFFALSTIASLATLSTRPTLCEFAPSTDLFSQLRTSQIPFEKLPMPGEFVTFLQDSSEMLDGHLASYCQVTKPFPTLTELIEQFTTHKLKICITALSMIPPLTIMLYSNISLRPGTKDRSSPTITLLPYLLFLTSIPVYLFFGESQIPDQDGVDVDLSVVLPLLPITLLMAFRGSAAKGSIQGGSQIEDEVWKVGVGLNVLSIVHLIPIGCGIIQNVLFSAVTVLWIYAIGASSWLSLLVIARLTSIALIPPSILLKYIQPVEVLVVKGVFAMAWFWGMKKLIENAWAMGGLSGRDRKKRKSKDKVN
ncbi:uncharacterized protein I303_101275 [Kwoniella dejecticola CBS 10117]|uniref:Uncharacterized protein n=1 Tax=Kwoniella dejecticola CBS 10117 TaxID=1296121 RepID=A0A1A6AHC0_9TREE|nr:uncharacterized protein I303_01283 [Kwoniella dejecticola CBS 10117]OBR89456.1 hypothetical protein I303_01283 [Kwoniella dejecticola CBS 10117]